MDVATKADPNYLVISGMCLPELTDVLRVRLISGDGMSRWGEDSISLEEFRTMKVLKMFVLPCRLHTRIARDSDEDVPVVKDP